MCYTLSPKSSSATYWEGDYTFILEGIEKNLSKSIYNVNLNSRQKNLYFNSSTDLEINLKDKKPNITNNRLSIYNKLYNLELFNLSFEIGKLVEPNVDLYGAKFETIKKSETKTTNAMFFAGKSTTSQIVGTKINTQYGSNTSYSLFLLNKKDVKENNQIIGMNFSKPIHKFSLLQGEYYLDNKDKWGLLLKNSIDYKKIILQTEYSIIDNVPAFELFSIYKTKTSNTELEYSIINQEILWKLNGIFETKNLRTGGGISTKKNKSSLAQETLSYNGYAKYKWMFLEKITPSILYNHSYNHTSVLLESKNINDCISFGINYFDLKSRLSISTQIGVEKAKQQTKNSIKKELTFERSIGLRYEYREFKPWVNFKLRTTEDKMNTPYQKESNYISYGISRNITRNLTLSYNCYQTGYKSEASRERINNNRINKYLTLDYRLPKLPITLMTRLSWINNNKPTSFLSITYRNNNKKDTFVKYQDNEIKYTRERPIKFGTLTENIAYLSKEFPNQDELFHLGKIIIMIFKDNAEENVPIKGIKVKLNKTEIITNEDGKASFIDIPPGTYTFSIDLSEIPIGFTCKTKVEPIIKIKEGEDIYLNFPIVQTGKISGGVFIDKNRNGRWDEKEKGAGDILIYANDIPNYTSFSGKYKVQNIIPGIVKVKIELNSIPENFEVTTQNSVEVNLLPKQEIKNINFGIAEIEPEIEFEE